MCFNVVVMFGPHRGFQDMSWKDEMQIHVGVGLVTRHMDRSDRSLLKCAQRTWTKQLQGSNVVNKMNAMKYRLALKYYAV